MSSRRKKLKMTPEKKRELRQAGEALWASLTAEERKQLTFGLRKGLIGKKVTLPIRKVLPDKIYKIRKDIIRLFASGHRKLMVYAGRAPYFTHLSRRIGLVRAGLRVEKFFNFYTKWVKGTVQPGPVLILYEEESGWVKRFDGTHRACLSRFFGERKIKCRFVSPEDVVSWKAKMESDVDVSA